MADTLKLIIAPAAQRPKKTCRIFINTACKHRAKPKQRRILNNSKDQSGRCPRNPKRASNDQELAQVVRDAELGKRILDKLVQVVTHQGDERWVYIHVEIQGQHDADFPERLFTYNYRLYDKYRRPIASLVVLADDRKNWKPHTFGYELFGSKHYLEFPSVKLLDYQPQTEALLEDPNPFALVTAAHLLTQQTQGDNQQRLAAKWRLAKLLYARNWSKQRIIDLFSVIDWMMRLPEELQNQLWQDIEQFERNCAMPYITSVERIGIEKGIQQGMQQGMQQGWQEGSQHGHQLGRHEEATHMLLRQITRRFGPPSAETQARLKTATLEQLEQWADNILDAVTLEDVFKSH